MLKKKKFSFNSLRQLLLRKGVLYEEESKITGKKRLMARHLFGIIKHQSPELYNKIFDFFAYKKPGKVPLPLYFKKEVTEARVLDAMWHGVKSHKEIVKYSKIRKDDVSRILNTSKNPIIKMWVREHEKRRQRKIASGQRVGSKIGVKHKKRR